MSQNNVEIVYVDYGVANVIGGVIYMHKGLLEDRVLHDAVLTHELQHVYDPGNLKIDMNAAPPSGLTRWMIKHPSSFLQLAPVWYIDKRIIYSKFMIMFWVLIFLLLGGGIIFVEWLKLML
jgi:hypothetical protein